MVLHVLAHPPLPESLTRSRALIIGYGSGSRHCQMSRSRPARITAPTREHVFAPVPSQTRRVYRRPAQNGLILPAAAALDELSAAVPVPVADPLLVDVPDEVIPLPLAVVVELSPPTPVPVADAVELPEAAPDEPDDELVVSLVQLAVKKT